MDCISLLTADHNRVRGLFVQFGEAHENDDTPTMASLATKIATELRVHTTIEEEIFYPWVHGLSDDLAEVVNEGIEEHHEVKVLLGEIATLSPLDPAWVAKLTVVIENVGHHAEEEETEMFPKVRSATSAGDRDEVGTQLDARKGRLGAPVLADTIDLTNDQLHELATAQAIPGRSTMDHAELAATVNPA
jgi:hemerythrin superfamily protein